MILIHNKDFDELSKQTEQKLEENGFNTTPGSIAKLFSDIINKNISEFYETLTINHMQSFVTTATGNYLNAIGKLMACERLTDETDEDYRKRISNQTLTLSKANETSIRLAALSCDGIEDIVLKKYSHGPGSLTIIPITSKSNADKIYDLEKILSDIISCGEKLVVKHPTYKYIKINLSLIFSVNTDDTVKQSISIAVRQAVADYINSLKVGETIIINELTQRIMEVDDRIINYSCNKFKINNKNCLYINQSCRWDEKFSISPDLDSITIL